LGGFAIVLDPEHLDLLRIHTACQRLSAEEIETIAAQADVVHASAGELMHSADQAVDALLMVVGGRLKVMLKMPDGRQRTIRYISPGDEFGALMLVNEDNFPVDVIADETTTLLRWKKDIALQLAAEFPVFRRNLLRKIGCGVRDLLLPRHRRTMPKIVAFINADHQTRRLVVEFASRLAHIGERIGILCDSRDASQYDPTFSFKPLRDPDGEILDKAELHSTIQQWTDLSRLFLVLDGTHSADRLAFPIEASDAVFCFSATDRFHPALELLQSIIHDSPSWKKKTHFVWVLREEEKVAPLLPELTKLTTRDFKVRSSNSPAFTRQAAQDIDRIIHYLRGVSVGIALSGGAAHGMAHLGVLKAFEEEGITIDRMAGTSAGVLTGVLYCAGFSPDWGIHQFAHDLEPSSIYKHLPKGGGFYMLERYRSHSWDKMLRQYLFDWRLEQCPIPISTVTTDLISASSIVRTSGDAVDSILESINLPGLSPPICKDGMLLVDGGILNNLPADVLVRQGCNCVIGVDVSANIEHRVGDNFPDTPTEKMKPPGIVTTLLRSFNVQAHNLSSIGAHPADITIAPNVSMFESSAFTRTQEMAEIGHQTTMETMPQLREILQHLDGGLFRG
jgi:predicted acylesterase/phospholipase RssA/CRP-like cAMP-binding protein